MSSPNLAQVLDIVEAALALDAEERDAYVLAAAMGDRALLAAVRAALSAEPPDGFVEPPTDSGRGSAE